MSQRRRRFPVIFAFLGGLCVPALAEDIAFTCAHPTNATAIFVRTRGEEVVADVVHRKGTQMIPLGDDSVTAQDLPALAEKARLVDSLGAHWTFRWPKANCRKDGEGRFDCTRADWQKVNGRDVKPFSFWSTRGVESDVHDRWETTKVKLYLLTKSEGAAKEPVLTFAFLAGQCFAGEDPDALRSFGIDP